MSESTAPGSRRFELGTDGPLAILVGIDGSPSSMRATAYAAGLARRQHSRLLIVYVQQLAKGVGSAMLTEYVLDVGQDIAEGLEAYLRKAAAATEEFSRMDWQFITRRGDPYLELIAIAKQEKADAVVVGASESLGHRFAGSLATRLVRAGLCPVTVVP